MKVLIFNNAPLLCHINTDFDNLTQINPHNCMPTIVCKIRWNVEVYISITTEYRHYYIKNV